MELINVAGHLEGFGAVAAQAFTTAHVGLAVGFTGAGIVLATKAAGSQIKCRGFLGPVGSGAAIGDRVKVVTKGKLLTDLTGLTLGNSELYLGAAGILQVAEPSGGDYIQKVAYAITATKAYIDVSHVWTAS